MILGTVAGAMIQSMGWRVTFRIFAVAFAIVMVVGALLLRNAGAEFVAYLSQGSSKAVTPAVEEVGAAVMLRRRNFWIYFVWAIILSAAGLAIINSSAPYAQLFVGENLTLAASIAGIVSIANGVGRVIFGGMFDKIGYRLTMLIDCVVFVVASLVLMASFATKSMPVLVIAFILIGLAYGGVTPTNSAFIAYFFGRENYAVNFPHRQPEPDLRLLPRPHGGQRRIHDDLRRHHRLRYRRRSAGLPAEEAGTELTGKDI